jgi:hypothetical protein
VDVLIQNKFRMEECENVAIDKSELIAVNLLAKIFFTLLLASAKRGNISWALKLLDLSFEKLLVVL